MPSEEKNEEEEWEQESVEERKEGENEENEEEESREERHGAEGFVGKKRSGWWGSGDSREATAKTLRTGRWME